MTAADQLQMFEPKGVELDRLAEKHIADYKSLLRLETMFKDYELPVRSERAGRAAGIALESAYVCEMALQFEQLAELV